MKHYSCPQNRTMNYGYGSILILFSKKDILCQNSLLITSTCHKKNHVYLCLLFTNVRPIVDLNHHYHSIWCLQSRSPCWWQPLRLACILYWYLFSASVFLSDKQDASLLSWVKIIINLSTVVECYLLCFCSYINFWVVKVTLELLMSFCPSVRPSICIKSTSDIWYLWYLRSHLPSHLYVIMHAIMPISYLICLCNF